MKKVVLFGVFSEIVELCKRKGIEIACGIDPKVDNKAYNFEVFQNELNFFQAYSKSLESFEYIIVPDTPKVRFGIFQGNKSKIPMKHYAIIIDDNVFLSETVKIGYGTIILSGSLVSSNSIIGNFVKMNFFARVHHDVVVEDFCTIAPGATVLGRVHIGKGAYIGANATILPNITIGEWATIGAGAVVTKNVEAHEVVAGVPAKKLTK
ncbi:MAG: hypothetical protein PWQ70_3295 [Clostridiales bacterium]|nr:hypothetical protein [Clostridiales bacterium]